MLDVRILETAGPADASRFLEAFEREIDGAGAVGAGRLAIRRQQDMLAAGESFALETTLSGRHEIDVMRQAAARGYKVNLVFIALGTPDLSIGRIVQRVLDGGHNIPAVDVKRRYSNSGSSTHWSSRGRWVHHATPF